MVASDICPREKEFQTVLETLCRELTRVVHGGNRYECILFAGSGTAVMDACINSVVPPGKKILIVNNGAYGQRMVNIAAAYGIEVVEYALPGDTPPDLHELDRRLQGDSDIACVAMIHHETTTGLLNPVKEAGAIVHKLDRVFIVDAISSYAALPISIEDWKIDFLLSTSNKCIQGMAGIGIVIADREKLEKTAFYPKRSYYLNLHQQYAYFKKSGQLPFTAPVQVVYALAQATKEYFEEGEANRWARYQGNWKLLYQGLIELGYRMLLPVERESGVLIAVREPTHPKFDFNDLHDRLYEMGFTIYPGKIETNRTFRLAVIGDLYVEDMNQFLASLRRAMEAMGIQGNLYPEQ